jgi:hypothetical protein
VEVEGLGGAGHRFTKDADRVCSLRRHGEGSAEAEGAEEEGPAWRHDEGRRGAGLGGGASPSFV